MKVSIQVRVTRRKRCRAGFYLLIAGERYWSSTRSGAVGMAIRVFDGIKVQVCTVDEFSEAVRRRKGKV